MQRNLGDAAAHQACAYNRNRLDIHDRSTPFGSVINSANRTFNSGVQERTPLLGFRKQGIAHALLLFALDFAYNKGGVMYFLEVRRGNQAALNLYRKVGFAAWRVRRNYYADTGEDALIMRLFYGDRIYARQGDGQPRLP